MVKQEPQQWVQLYFEKLDKLFRKGKVKNPKHRHRFLAHIHLKSR
jgi:hypothetical protein